LPEEVAVVRDSSVGKSCADAVFRGGAVDEGFAPSDEFPRFAELVRRDVTR
jgi:hypothetical protein